MKRILAACAVLAAAVAWGEDGAAERVAKRAAECTCLLTDAESAREDGKQCPQCFTGMTHAPDDALCIRCARAKDLCEHCGLPNGPSGTPMVLVGTLSLVDKQPRRDMKYYVLTRDDGSTQGVYIDLHRRGDCAQDGRLLVRAVSTEEGAVVIVREAFALGPKDKDGVFEGKSATPVRWAVGGIRSEPVDPVDGAYTVTVPAVVGVPVTIHADGKARIVEFDGKAWSEK
jgi:hypothetical protein